MTESNQCFQVYNVTSDFCHAKHHLVLCQPQMSLTPAESMISQGHHRDTVWQKAKALEHTRTQ